MAEGGLPSLILHCAEMTNDLTMAVKTLRRLSMTCSMQEFSDALTKAEECLQRAGILAHERHRLVTAGRLSSGGVGQGWKDGAGALQ